MKAPILFTHNAASKVWELIQEEGNFNLKLRVYVTGGGCSGFQYGFKFDEQVNNDDTVVTCRLNDQQAVQANDEEDEGAGGGNAGAVSELNDASCVSDDHAGKGEVGAAGAASLLNDASCASDNHAEKENDNEGHGNPVVSLLVDPLSFQYLIGAEIDYTEGLEGAQFVIRNPNAKTTCGCGSSFSA